MFYSVIYNTGNVVVSRGTERDEITGIKKCRRNASSDIGGL
ncbi:hypothetical protein [Sebaldella sp. S0638]|nr:hypothetical protein [Sebaldella sp. S0638]